ncbi:MAG: ribose-phosphate diphosphokinase, partial [Chloroflexi bacterium]|nr:ribose-phosphate diphosphokinase [Chloroflexota bacterium]
AAHLDLPLAIIEKRRMGNTDRTESLNVIGEVEGKKAILVDDEVDTGGSLAAAARALVAQGAAFVSAVVVHPVLSPPAMKTLPTAPLKELVVTDSIPVSREKQDALNLTVLPIAPLLGEAIRRIHEGRSVGEMFEGLGLGKDA